MSKISLTDGVGIFTSFFTAVAASAAAVSAYYSLSQTQMARQNIAKGEQLAAFDSFTLLANSVCKDLDSPDIDALWDPKRDDFRADFDVSILEGKQGIGSEPLTMTATNIRKDLIVKFDDLKFQALRLTHLDSPTFKPSFVSD